jgi:hypothetical protein
MIWIYAGVFLWALYSTGDFLQRALIIVGAAALLTVWVLDVRLAGVSLEEAYNWFFEVLVPLAVGVWVTGLVAVGFVLGLYGLIEWLLSPTRWWDLPERFSDAFWDRVMRLLRLDR